jgi:DNA-binding NarL/FixJ family response regulator
VHRRQSTDAGASQIDIRDSRILREGRVEQLQSYKDSSGGVGVCGLLEYKQEGLDAEAVAWHIKQRFPKLPIVLLSADSEMPERILWLVDEYVMKSELTEQLVPIIERAHSLTLRSDVRQQSREAAA